MPFNSFRDFVPGYTEPSGNDLNETQGYAISRYKQIIHPRSQGLFPTRERGREKALGTRMQIIHYCLPFPLYVIIRRRQIAGPHQN